MPVADSGRLRLSGRGRHEGQGQRWAKRGPVPQLLEGRVRLVHRDVLGEEHGAEDVHAGQVRCWACAGRV